MATFDIGLVESLEKGNMIETKPLFPALCDNKVCWMVSSVHTHPDKTIVNFDIYYMNVFLCTRTVMAKDGEVRWLEVPK